MVPWISMKNEILLLEMLHEHVRRQEIVVNVVEVEGCVCIENIKL
jgi:hypothetical protein